MQGLVNLILLAMFVLVPGAAIYFGFKMKKRADQAEELNREAKLKEILESTRKYIDRLDREGVARAANELYPGDGSKRSDDN